MNNLQNMLQYIFQDIDRLLEKNKEYGQNQNNLKDKLLKLYDNTKNGTFLAVGLSSGDDALIHSQLYQTLSLLKLNIAVVEIIYNTLEKLENEFPEKINNIKSELVSQVKNTLEPIHAKYEKEKEFVEEVNKAAKDREKYIGDMFG